VDTWPTKDPNEVLDYQFDWDAPPEQGGPRLATGETITTSTFILASGDVTIDSMSFSGGLTTVWLSGGTAGGVNVITNRVVTSAGRTYDQSARLRVRSL
jgi:hypothetical protein